VGYDRYNSHQALEYLNRLYELVRLYTNFFQPVVKLKFKTRHGARVHKVYDTAHTPYQRLAASGVLDGTQQDELERDYRSLNPVHLRAQIDAALEELWKHAVYPIPQHTVNKSEASVT